VKNGGGSFCWGRGRSVRGRSVRGSEEGWLSESELKDILELEDMGWGLFC